MERLSRSAQKDRNMSSILVKNEARLGLKLVAPAVGIIGLLVIYPILFNI